MQPGGETSDPDAPGFLWVPTVGQRRTTDLADAVSYAKAHASEPPFSGAIYGGVAGGMTTEADSLIRTVMADMLDKQTSLPPEPTG